MIKEILRPLVPKFIREQRLQKKHQQLLKEWKENGRPAPPPHIVKQMAIQEYQKQSDYSVFVETGTYMGDMIEAQKPYFKELHSIELSEDLYHKAIKRFKHDHNVFIVQGDSAKVLPEVMDKISKPAIFWLDGHYSAGPTARGDKDCPIYGEINSIFNNSDLPHILLIDDARDFNGSNDYPTIDELTAYVKHKRSDYKVEVKDDIIRVSL